MRQLPFLAMLCCVASFVLPSAVFAAETSVESLPPGIFHMADGSYYHPGSGSHAATLDEVLRAAGLPPVIPADAGTPPTSTPTTSEPVVPYSMPTPIDPFPLKSAIRRGRELLQAKIDTDMVGKKPKVVTKEPDARHVTLAIWNPVTNDIRTVDGMKEGVKFAPDDKLNAGIRVITSNGVNSQFSIKGPDHEVVVAIRYPIYKDLSTSKKNKKFEQQDVTYTPYSSDVHTPEMVAYGKAWLEQQIADVYSVLGARGVPSRSVPNKRMVDVIDPQLTQLIMAIEHMNEGVTGQAAKNELERFYVTVGANESDAFDYSRSSVGALGIAQFMPKTYAFVATLPGLNLPKDFEAGMRIPSNAITAELAYLDYLLAQLPKATVATLAEHPDLVHEYIAASYNGGPARVKKAIAVWEENMDAKQRLHVLTRSRLKPETMKYVLKLRQVRDMLRKDAVQVATAV